MPVFNMTGPAKAFIWILEPITHIIKGCIRQEYKYQKILYERYLGFALKTVFRYMYRYEKAIDVVHDGFVKLFNHFPNFKAGKEEENEKILLAWIKKIMINVSIDELRKNQMIPEIGTIPEYVWGITDSNHDADQQIRYRELVALIIALPPPYRVVFNLYAIDGYSHAEISGMLNIPVGTSKSNLSRARMILQKNIQELEKVKLCGI
jgi:RNA polymerase sigma-70 factor (ECF subfamily)